MDLSSLLLFIPACFALNMAPGPNNLLSLHNASRYGLRTACVAGGGRIVAFSGMIALAAMGLAVVLHTSEYLFLTIKVVGAAYLFYIAWQLWRAPVGDAVLAADHPRGTWRLARQEFWVAAGNPKAILIFTAFLPQFVSVGSATPVSEQFLWLGVLFLLLEWAAIALYAGLGAYLQRWFSQPAPRRLFNRVSASLLGCAGLGLLAARR
ncbi:LysE family translocator [Pseudomonas sp. SWI6]|uniref:LysE family translocator n=1 Tax=Pseudomonas TaxID=286 RepID=UPI0003C08436|nr:MULTISPECIES: LysE family translocator [Pseudomonas]AGZ35453.1 lysine exporter protein LysE/YggA [Pseudomonas sp. VLB120]AVD83091.1 LysE family translocator [Pseudomonas sp. SWI6]AVD90251.1 LysE family translocator [Pseudomonas sp. SWI44]MDT8923582.1 LysE family translocator [Pseudomonas taiwanensis]MPT02002.1 LysE family translocator [Pseudomonas sp.]